MQQPCGTKTGLKVLVVAGDSSAASELPALLRDLGHEVAGVVAYGEEALRLSGNHACDLVVMDGVSGGPVDPVAAVASLRPHARLPIVFLVSDCDEETISRLLDSGPVSLVVKPVTRLRLCAAIGTAIRRADRPEPARSPEDYPRATFEAAPDSVFVRDRTLRFLYVNHAGERLFGIPRLDIVGKTCADLLPAELAARVAASDRRVLAGEEVVEEFRFRMQGLEEVLHVARFPIRESSGETVAIGAICRSLAGRKSDPDAVAPGAESAALLETASKLAFHFGNVLQVILGRSQLAAAQMEFGRYSAAWQSLERIQASCREASDVVTQLQRVSESGRDGFSEPSCIVDLSIVVGHVLQKERSRFNTDRNNSGVGLRIGLTQGCYVYGRGTDLAEMTSNLVRNAAEALPDQAPRRQVRDFRFGHDAILPVRERPEGVISELNGKGL